jgi:hypothetical protein
MTGHAQGPLTLLLTMSVAVDLSAGRWLEAVRFNHRGHRVLIHVGFAGVLLKPIRRWDFGGLHLLAPMTNPMGAGMPRHSISPSLMGAGKRVRFFHFWLTKFVRLTHTGRLVVFGDVSGTSANPRTVRLLGMTHAAVLNQFRPLSVCWDVGNRLVAVFTSLVHFATPMFLLFLVEALAGMPLGAVMDANGFATWLFGMSARVILTVGGFAFAHRHWGIS